MRRIVLFLLPLFVLTACERSVPTAADLWDAGISTTLAVTLDVNADVTKINLANASTVQVIVPSTAAVPTSATLTNTDNEAWADPMHTFDAGCETHFQDLDGDGYVDALFLHFDAGTLFDSYGTTPPVDPITLSLDVDWVDAEGTPTGYDAVYTVQLVYTVPSGYGYRGGR